MDYSMSETDPLWYVVVWRNVEHATRSRMINALVSPNKQIALFEEEEAMMLSKGYVATTPEDLKAKMKIENGVPCAAPARVAFETFNWDQLEGIE